MRAHITKSGTLNSHHFDFVPQTNYCVTFLYINFIFPYKIKDKTCNRLKNHGL